MEFEKRKYSRSAFYQIIPYSLLPYIDNKVSTGLLHDFSYSGLCILTLDHLQEGQEIVVKSGLMSSNSRTAVVRWCSDMKNSTYKVGLEFKN
jgi:c-di-GMP-binding flagellar brake protein YcgR